MKHPILSVTKSLFDDGNVHVIITYIDPNEQRYQVQLVISHTQILQSRECLNTAFIVRDNLYRLLEIVPERYHISIHNALNYIL